MTKKEKLVQKINNLLTEDRHIDESMTTKELEAVLAELEKPAELRPIMAKVEEDVSTVKAIHNKMRIINAKLKSTDLKDQEEGKADLEALTIKIREEANKIDIRTKFLGNV